METIKLSFAGQSFEIREFTLGQLEDIQESLTKPPPAGEAKIGADRELIAIALSEDHGHVTAEALRKMRFGSIRKTDEVTKQILRFAGYKVQPEKTDPDTKEVGSGEASAG